MWLSFSAMQLTLWWQLYTVIVSLYIHGNLHKLRFTYHNHKISTYVCVCMSGLTRWPWPIGLYVDVITCMMTRMLLLDRITQKAGLANMPPTNKYIHVQAYLNYTTYTNTNMLLFMLVHFIPVHNTKFPLFLTAKLLLWYWLRITSVLGPLLGPTFTFCNNFHRNRLVLWLVIYFCNRQSHTT